MTTKACNKCGETKPLVDGFYRASRTTDGFMNLCKVCHCAACAVRRTPNGKINGRPRSHTPVEGYYGESTKGLDLQHLWPSVAQRESETE